MNIIKPIPFVNSQLISTTAVNAEANWSSGTTYSLNTVVTYSGKRWISLQASNTNHQPDTSPSWWLDLGASNQFAMFDNVTNKVTTATTSLTVVYAPGVSFDSIALLEVDASVVKVTVRDGLAGPIVFEETAGLSGADVTNWYDYFFSDPLLKRTQIIFRGIPPYANAHVTIELTTSVGVTTSISQVVAGNFTSVGLTEYGARVGIIDYSVKQTDEFGNTTFVQRAFSKRLTATANIPNSQLNRVQNFLYSIRAMPVLWIASDDPTYEETLVVYGYYRDLSTTIAYPTYSSCSLEIEGLA